MWYFDGVYTYKPKKVPGEEHLDCDGTNRFDAEVVLTNEEYVVKHFSESSRIRSGMDK